MVSCRTLDFGRFFQDLGQFVFQTRTLDFGRFDLGLRDLGLTFGHLDFGLGLWTVLRTLDYELLLLLDSQRKKEVD